jgi:hypothetical protein
MSVGIQKLGYANARHKRLADFIEYRKFVAERRLISKLQGTGEEKSDLGHLQDNIYTWKCMKVLNDEKYTARKRAILANPKDFEVVAPMHNFKEEDTMEKRTVWSRVKSFVGWSALVGTFSALVAVIASTVIEAPTYMRDYNGNKPRVFEMTFQKERIKDENTMRIKENTEKAWAEQKQAKQDSVAKAQQARNDSIKTAMAKKHMKPRAKTVQPSQLRVIKH